MKRQTYQLEFSGNRAIANVAAMGLNQPEGRYTRYGRDWQRYQVCRHSTYSLFALEAFFSEQDVNYTRQEHYVKISFWVRGRHATVLDGFGQFEHDRPEVIITSSPFDRIKVDVFNKGSTNACVALCVLPAFFPDQMGIGLDELPKPLSTLLNSCDRPYGFFRLPLTPALSAAARAILAAPFEVRRTALYSSAKTVELMCLLINSMARPSGEASPGTIGSRHDARLHQARDLLTDRFAVDITLEQISREVGLNRMALTSGFQRLFKTSVHDFQHKLRMERAYELLEEHTLSVTRVAEEVGYADACNFSTAFRAYFGCSPQKVRSIRNSPPPLLR